MTEKQAEKPPVKLPQDQPPKYSADRFSEISEVHEEEKKVAKHEAFLYGVLGAFLGSLPGMTVWIILGKFGIRAMILGFFLAAGTVWGYGIMTKKYPLWRGWGILICTVIMISSVYLAQKITWTWGISDAFKNTNEYLNQQMLAANKDNEDLDRESIRKSVEALNKRTFGFSKGTFAECYTHFYSLLDFLDLKKDFISSLIQSYISAALGAASLLKNKVRKKVDGDLVAADKKDKNGKSDKNDKNDKSVKSEKVKKEIRL